MSKETNTSKNKGQNSAAEKPERRTVIRVLVDNRRARYEYEILEAFEAGIALFGTEIKSLRHGRGNLADAFARVEGGELWLYNCNITPYDFGNRFNHEPMRKRKLLMHKSQIFKLKSKIQEKGLTLIPMKLYLKGNKAKLDLAIAKGKQLYDKRQTIAKRDTKRQIERLMKDR